MKCTSLSSASLRYVSLCALAVLIALALVPVQAWGADNIGSLVNASFATSWTYRSGGVPSAPGGWAMAGWAATAGGPQYYTGAELNSGNPTADRCKWEFSSGGISGNNVIAKEVNWGSYTSATVTVYCAGRAWSGGLAGTMYLGIDDNGAGTQWSDCGTNTVSRTSSASTWATITKTVSKPGGATTFTVMLNAIPLDAKWNCQFDEMTITGSNPCTPPATPGAPTVNGATSTSLNVANNASDSGTPYFAFRINGGSYTNQFVQANGSVGASAVWQTKATWGTKTVTGLASNTTYTFTVVAANDSAGSCPSSYGTGTAGTTTCNTPATPGAPTISGVTGTTINVANNASDSGTAYFAFRINGGSYTNQYVQANGSVGASAVWQTKATWGTKTVTGLASNTTYTFDVKAATDAIGSCASGFGTSAQGTTTCAAPATPGAPTVNGATSTSLNVTNNAGDSGTAYFAFRVNGGGYTNQYVQANGSVGASAIWQTKATWGTKTVTGLTSGITYTFDVKAANDSSGNCASGFGTTSQGTTTAGCGGETVGSLVNPCFATAWTYRQGSVPTAPSGWTLGDWGATNGGCMQLTTSGDCASGRPTDHRCKFELGGSGQMTDNMIYKEISWGSASSVTVSVACSKHAWGGDGTQSLSVKASGCANRWVNRDRNLWAINYNGECSWTTLTLTFARPAGATSFTVMLNAHPGDTTQWNCQFDNLQVTLSGNVGTLTGNVKNSGLSNLSGVTVSTNTGGWTGTTDANGNYTINNVATGTYTVKAMKAGYNLGSQSGVTVSSGATTTTNFTLTTGSSNGSITGKVKNATNSVLSGATISTSPATSTTTTAADGTFTLTNVPPGTYSVMASATNYQSHSWSSITVVANFPTAVADYYLVRSGSKIGLHFSGQSTEHYVEDLLTPLSSAGLSVHCVKCLGQFGKATEAKSYCAGSFSVGRVNDLPDGTFIEGFDSDAKVGRDPAVTATNVYNSYKSTIQANPNIDVWEVCNEWNGQYEWQADFYCKLMDLAEADGYRIALFSCSTGTPEVLANWQYLAKACARAKAHGGHVLALHEYALDLTATQHIEDEYNYEVANNMQHSNITHYRYIHDYLVGYNADCPIVITECGNNAGSGQDTDHDIVHDMAFYDNLIRQDSYLIGCALYDNGGSDINYGHAGNTVYSGYANWMIYGQLP